MRFFLGFPKQSENLFILFLGRRYFMCLQVQEDHEYNREHTLKIRLRPKPWAICFDDGGEIGPWNYAG